jgi:protein-tyrosine phosphatase
MHTRFAAVLLLAVSAIAHADVTQPVCTQNGPNSYKISFTLTGDSKTVSISASSNPSGTTDRAPVLETQQTEVTVTAGQPGQRMYFFLEPNHGRGREVSIRHIDLQGTPNFRDEGGYETTDGRFVRWGLIYRSGVLSHLTASDFTYLAQLGVRVVCDFRTADENAVAPEVWIPGSDVDRVSVPIGTAGSKDVNTPLKKFMATNPTEEQAKAWLAKIYGDFALTNAPEYAKVLAQLKQDHLPLLYHCTAGKDRTGVFSAFLLLTLGVPEKTVLADYELTNKYLLDAVSPAANQKMLASSSPDLAHLSPGVMRALMAADPDYLRGTLRRIDQQFGSFDNYRRSELGVSDADVEALKARLLER